jgi:outer membrane autotransporter protein
VAEITGANIYSSTSTVGGNAIFKLNATGGNATATDNSAYASAIAYGITVFGVGTAAYTIGGNVELNIKAIGGKSTGADAGASAYVYGLQTCMVGSGNLTINGDAIIDVSAIGGTATGAVSTISSAMAVGLNVWSFYGMGGGNVVNTITGNVAITAEATATQAGQEFNAYSLCAGKEFMGGTNDLSSSGTTKTIEGDVYATHGGVNKLVLDTAGSYLQGNIVNGDGTGDNEISVSNGAEWRPVYDNRYGTDCVAYTDAEAATKNVKTYTVATRSTDKLTLSDGGSVNLLWDGDRDSYRTLNISSLAGDAGVFNIKTDLNSETDGDVINVTTGETGSTQYITVTDSSENTGNMVTGNKKLLVATDKSGSYTFTGKTLDAGGLWETTPTIENLDGNNWYLTMIKAEPNPSTSDVIGTFESGYGLWRSTILDDTLRKRLGDLRYEDENMSGLWARVKAGKLSADTYDSSYQMYQVGMDKKVGNSIYGFVVDHSRNSNTLTSGVGEGSNTGLSLYATNYHDSGAYSDVILRAGKLRTDMHSNGTYKDSFDYAAWGYSASYEVGKTFRKDNGWFVEPQAQLVYGHLAGGDYTTDRGVSVNRDSINSFIGRLGFVLGRQVNKNADYYFKANVYREFGGSGDMNLVYGSQKMNYDGNHKDTWFEMGIGTNVKLSNNTYFYGDVLKTFGADIQKKWQVNAGFRWTWGGAKK